MQIRGEDTGDYLKLICVCSNDPLGSPILNIEYLGRRDVGTPAIKVHCPRCDKSKVYKLHISQGLKGFPPDPESEARSEIKPNIVNKRKIETRMFSSSPGTWHAEHRVWETMDGTGEARTTNDANISAQTEDEAYGQAIGNLRLLLNKGII